MVRCKAKTISKKRCKLSVMISDGEYCHIHSNMYRNFTDKYCEYDKIGLVNKTVDLEEYIEEKYWLVYSPFKEFMKLINNYKYVFSNDEYNNLMEKINNEYDTFLQTDRSLTSRNVSELTLTIYSIEHKLIVNDSKTIQIINDKNLELFYYGKKYIIDDIYKTLSIVNFYIDYYILNVLYNNSIKSYNYRSAETNSICLKLYKKMKQSKNDIIKNIQIINKRQTEKNNYLRLLNFTILPKDIIKYVIGPFL